MADSESLADLLKVISHDIAGLKSKEIEQDLKIDSLLKLTVTNSDLLSLQQPNIIELQVICDTFKTIQSYLFAALSYTDPKVYSTLIGEMKKIFAQVSEKDDAFHIEFAKQLSSLIDTQQQTSETAPHLRLVFSKKPEPGLRD
jgi:hypothetical protein